MPYRRIALMHRCRKTARVGEHQLSHVLSRDPDQFGYISKAHQIRSDLDQPGRGHSPTHIRQSTAHSCIRAVSLSGELQCQPPRLANADKSIVAASVAKALDQQIWVPISFGKLVFQREYVFHSPTPLHRRRLSAFYDVWCSYPRRALRRVRGYTGSSACSIRW